MRLRLIIIVLICLISVNVFAKKYKIGIASIKNLANVNQKVVAVIEGELSNMFVNLGYFDIVDRTNLNTIMQEQRLTLSGLTDVNQTSQIGKILGLDYLLFCDILLVDQTQEKVTDYTTGKKKYVPKFTVKLKLQIVDVATARIEFSKTQEQTMYADESPLNVLNSTVEDVFESLKFEVKNAYPRQGYIIKIDNDEVMIDCGTEMGIKSGMEFEVYEKGKSIKHPVSGKIIPGKLVKKGKILIEDVQESISTGKIKSGKIKVGQIVRSTKEYRPKAFEFGINVGLAPYKMSASNFNLIYNDGYDDYYISLNQKATSYVPVISVYSSYNYGYKFNKDIPFKVAGSLYINDPILGIRVEAGLGYRAKINDSLKFFIEGGALALLGMGKIGEVGIGNNTGANYMLGPGGERIDQGSDIHVTAFLLGGYASAGLDIPFNRSSGLMLTSTFTYAPEFNDWTIEAWDEDGGSDGKGEWVELAGQSFQNLVNMSSLNLTGVDAKINLYFKL